MTINTLEQLDYWLNGSEPQAKRWRAGLAPDEMAALNAERVRLRKEAEERRKAELQAHWRELAGKWRAERELKETARKLSMAAGIAERQERARQERETALKTQARLQWIRDGGELDEFEGAWPAIHEAILRDNAAQAAKSPERAKLSL
ncbi:MAG: hypothetical protein ACRDIB_17285 [Ardenticatenaceae bacterium]